MVCDILPAAAKPPEIFLQGLRSITMFSAVITAILGMLLYIEQSVAGEAVQYHKWLGVELALLSCAYCGAHAYLQARIPLFRVSAVALLVLIVITAHFGATITHGENFLTGPLQKIEPAIIDTNQLTAWEAVYPILKTRCGDCHIGSVQKGGLSMNDSAAIIKGGKEGKCIVAGDSNNSQLIHRLLLPLSDKKHMPEADKPQPTPAEINILISWIKSGAPFSQLVINRPENDQFRQLAMASNKANLQSSTRTYSFAAADAGEIKKLTDNYRVIQSLAKDIPALSVSFFGKANFSSQRLIELQPLQEQIVSLQLAKVPVTNNDLAWIGKLPHLEKLNLNYTQVTDEGLSQLTSLTALESLSLTGTSVTAKGIAEFLQKRNVKELFLWDTPIPTQEIANLQKQFSKTVIEAGFRGGDTTVLALNDPIIQTTEGFFTGAQYLQIRHVIKGADLHYTLDGKEPDSASSLYTQPIAINATTSLQVKAYKKEWLPSKVVRKNFIRTGFSFVGATFLLPADQKYRENAENVLKDFDAGDPTDFSTKWLGFQKNDALVVLDAGEERMLQELQINALINVGAHIFPPVFIKVWGSKDGKNWTLLQTVNPSKAMPTTPSGAQLIPITFQATKVRYVKMQAHPVPVLPNWHPGKGLPAWFFVSEVVGN
jgi:phage-related protein